MALKEEHIIVEEKKATTQALIESIGREKAVVDEAVEAAREDEEAAAKLQVHYLSDPYTNVIMLHGLAPTSAPFHAARRRR